MAMATMAVTGVIIMGTTATIDTVAIVASISHLVFNDLAFIRSPYQASSIPLLLAFFLIVGG
ncbi:MAG: hypothetical protein ABGX16_03915 [Pirellulales bacterium]